MVKLHRLYHKYFGFQENYLQQHKKYFEVFSFIIIVVVEFYFKNNINYVQVKPAGVNVLNN